MTSRLCVYRNDIYGKTYDPGYFYEQEKAATAFDRRISAILNYRGAHSGRVWKDWTDVIMAFDLQNEPFAPEPAKCRQPSAEKWVCGRASHMRSVLGAENPIRVASGGFGGDVSHGCTFVGTSCEDLDIMSGMHSPEVNHHSRNNSTHKTYTRTYSPPLRRAPRQQPRPMVLAVPPVDEPVQR